MFLNRNPIPGGPLRPRLKPHYKQVWFGIPSGSVVHRAGYSRWSWTKGSDATSFALESSDGTKRRNCELSNAFVGGRTEEAVELSFDCTGAKSENSSNFRFQTPSRWSPFIPGSPNNYRRKSLNIKYRPKIRSFDSFWIPEGTISPSILKRLNDLLSPILDFSYVGLDQQGFWACTRLTGRLCPHPNLFRWNLDAGLFFQDQLKTKQNKFPRKLIFSRDIAGTGIPLPSSLLIANNDALDREIEDKQRNDNFLGYNIDLRSYTIPNRQQLIEAYNARKQKIIDDYRAEQANKIQTNLNKLQETINTLKLKRKGKLHDALSNLNNAQIVDDVLTTIQNGKSHKSPSNYKSLENLRSAAEFLGSRWTGIGAGVSGELDESEIEKTPFEAWNIYSKKMRENGGCPEKAIVNMQEESGRAFSNCYKAAYKVFNRIKANLPDDGKAEALSKIDHECYSIALSAFGMEVTGNSLTALYTGIDGSPLTQGSNNYLFDTTKKQEKVFNNCAKSKQDFVKCSKNALEAVLVFRCQDDDLGVKNLCLKASSGCKLTHIGSCSEDLCS
eukprot:g4020.t1